jgi:hypothetical protein
MVAIIIHSLGQAMGLRAGVHRPDATIALRRVAHLGDVHETEAVLAFCS